jgi:hypothetical protein
VASAAAAVATGAAAAATAAELMLPVPFYRLNHMASVFLTGFQRYAAAVLLDPSANTMNKWLHVCCGVTQGPVCISPCSCSMVAFV